MTIEKEKIKVLVVDDSAVARQTLSEIINSDQELQVIDVAADPFFAVEKMRKQAPDVLTLDIEMPRMDGLTFLRQLMSQHPLPVVVISSLTEEGSQTAIKALQYGAAEIITKPKLVTRQFYIESSIRIIDAVKAAAKVSTSKLKEFKDKNTPISSKYTSEQLFSLKKINSNLETTDKVVLMGVSTGGPQTLTEILKELNYDCPPIAIVQHMPEMFTKSFANRLNEICKITIKEAESYDKMLYGQALIAPGNKHILLKRSGAKYYVEVVDGPLVNRHRPSVDVLFRSAARYATNNAIGIILTGMGADGAKGLLEMKEAGAITIAQEEKSCIVYGMPRVAVEINAAQKILTPKQIADFINSIK